MKRLIDFLNCGVSSYHVVEKCKELLMNNGFKEIKLNEEIGNLKGKFYVSPYPSVLFAFTVGESIKSIRMAGGHTDFPSLKIKPNADIKNKNYLQINVEPYGGLIEQTWFDRPLGIAGKVVLRSEGVFKPRVRLFNSEEAICIIPSLAKHLRTSGDDKAINVQKELLPIIGLAEGEIVDINDFVAKKLDIDRSEILDYDLYLYIAEDAKKVGYNSEFIASPRIDNISSDVALLEGIMGDEVEGQLNIAAFFDNEEVGSRSKQGADSILLYSVIDKILGAKGYEISNFYSDMFVLSVDVAHAMHPNYADKNDITNDLFLGSGVALKTSASQRYASDSEATAILLALCEQYNVKAQRQVNRSGMRGGSTIGPLLASYFPVLSLDIGMPMLAMHSARELASFEDYEELCKLIKGFYSAN